MGDLSEKICIILFRKEAKGLLILRQMGVYLLHDCKATYAKGFEFPDGFNSENYLDKAWKNTAKSTFEIEVDTDNKILSVQCIQYACSKHLESVAINKCND